MKHQGTIISIIHPLNTTDIFQWKDISLQAQNNNLIVGCKSQVIKEVRQSDSSSKSKWSTTTQDHSAIVSVMANVKSMSKVFNKSEETGKGQNQVVECVHTAVILTSGQEAQMLRCFAAVFLVASRTQTGDLTNCYYYTASPKWIVKSTITYLITSLAIFSIKPLPS